MDIMMFIIFLVTDLFLIFCFQFAFSSGYRYQNGMYLGVHIPADHKDDPDVSDLITSSRQSMKHFQIINTLISIAICFINFASIAIFAMVYCVWIFEYCFFIIMLNNSCHKKCMHSRCKTAGSSNPSRKRYTSTPAFRLMLAAHRLASNGI